MITYSPIPLVKSSYLKELEKPKTTIKRGMTGVDVVRVQEWLNLQTFFQPAFKWKCTVDGDFGPQTEATVKKFQKHVGEKEDGVVYPETTWIKLTFPMHRAFSTNAFDKRFSIRELILSTAQLHLDSSPRELNNNNEGPWVRAYMGGRDGQPWAWCVGSALTIIDQSLSMIGEKFTRYLPNTLSCDVLANHALKNNRLIRNVDLKKLTFAELQAAVKPGDLLNLSKTPTDWTHTALITGVFTDYFETWEGNTNDEGSREGFEVCARVRNFHRQNVDVIQLGID